MSEIFTRLRSIYIGAVLLTTLLALGFIRINLMESSAESMRQFTQSNRTEIANADTLVLATKLNALLASESIRCISGKYKSKSFVNFAKGSCSSSLFVSESEYHYPTKEDLEIKLSFTIPTYILFAALSFILGEIILFFILFRINRQRILLDEKNKQLVFDISRQVAHDIRSPLSALNMISSGLSDIQEEKRVLIRNAIQRINDIANDLLSKGKPITGDTKEYFLQFNKKALNTVSLNTGKRDVVLLPILVDSIISEKRIQYRDKVGLQIEADTDRAYGVFVKINATEFSRALSNLINNSVEAMPDHNGKVTIFVHCQDQKVSITIQDNGKGIPKEMLAKLGEKGISIGKDGTQSGTGLGVWHAKSTIESIGGDFHIFSNLDNGTKVAMTLPVVESPNWFQSELTLKPTQMVITLDDDISIHSIWKDRLENLNYNNYQISLLNFTSGPAFKKYFDDLKQDNEKPLQTLLLIDYELLNQPQTGLEIIEELQLAKNPKYQVILITSRYDELYVRSRCEELGIKLIPKIMAGFIPIKLKMPSEKFDCILIDDDFLNHATWSIYARENNKTFKAFSTIKAFMTEAEQFNTETPVYIDSNLGPEGRGEDFAEVIHKLGFTKIYISTGYDPASLTPPECVTKVLGKNPNF